MRHALSAVAAGILLFYGYLWVAPHAHVFSIDLALNRTVYLGKYQSVLGQAFAGIILGLISALVCFVGRIRSGIAYITFGISAVVVAGLVLVPAWPSNNLVRATGELALIAATVVVSWVGLRALTIRSSRQITAAR